MPWGHWSALNIDSCCFCLPRGHSGRGSGISRVQGSIWQQLPFPWWAGLTGQSLWPVVAVAEHRHWGQPGGWGRHGWYSKTLLGTVSVLQHVSTCFPCWFHQVPFECVVMVWRVSLDQCILEQSLNGIKIIAIQPIPLTSAHWRHFVLTDLLNIK